MKKVIDKVAKMAIRNNANRVDFLERGFNGCIRGLLFPIQGILVTDALKSKCFRHTVNHP
jgi:hypothetical protein